MGTRILIGALMALILLAVILVPAGMGAPEMIGMLLIAAAVVSVWLWRRRRPKTPA